MAGEGTKLLLRRISTAPTCPLPTNRPDSSGLGIIRSRIGIELAVASDRMPFSSSIVVGGNIVCHIHKPLSSFGVQHLAPRRPFH